ncbi:MAG TPA: IS66 family transposase zinc-finger binding domain-containing protein, partial [Rhizomicrobium sp.]
MNLAALPTDVEALQNLVREQAALLQSKDLEIERLTARIVKLRRLQFGRSSEKIDREIEQLELLLDDLHENEGARAERPVVTSEAAHKPARRPLPDHLPREEVVHVDACVCPKCGGELRQLGEDVSEVLEYVPASFKVIRHVRPKFSCRRCEAITQAPMPSLPIERGRPGPGLLAHVLVSKYADHLPLYRQSEIYAREGLDLERSTLADW